MACMLTSDVKRMQVSYYAIVAICGLLVRSTASDNVHGLAKGRLSESFLQEGASALKDTVGFPKTMTLEAQGFTDAVLVFMVEIKLIFLVNPYSSRVFFLPWWLGVEADATMLSPKHQAPCRRWATCVWRCCQKNVKVAKGGSREQS